MSNDPNDDALRFMSGFDWITPLSDILGGFNSIEHEGWIDDCKRVEKELKKGGVKCRIRFIGDGWQVIAKRTKI